ncbi:MAG: ATP-binding protein [Planctomycetota bacterium]|nr:ATP-binding protein [Planctomycetota bacterium]
MAGTRRVGKSGPACGGKARGNKPGQFPVVGMGASAGGLEVFEQFFRFMPADSGMAFVLVSHLDPGHASMLTEILGRATRMPVTEAKDRMDVVPNHVYVIPPNRDMTIFHGKLQLRTPARPHGQRLPIDTFFRSLAEDLCERAVGMIFSGSGTDGTQGLRAIGGAGGVCFVQDPATARYEGMPASASQLATYVLTVDKMPSQLAACMKLGRLAPAPAVPAPAILSVFGRIAQVLRTRTGHDFSLYKKNTVCRRVERRMAVHGIEKVADYAQYLQEHAEEAQLLFKELLINVTSFFRDAEAFAALARDVLQGMLVGKPENYVFRLWAPGCASGEEAYSLAILLRECMVKAQRNFKVQIYATDLDEDAIATARSGLYPPNIAADVDAERLRRFFTKEDGGYRVKRDVRETIIFAVQDVAKDPPFTRLDLVSCRNLLIYLEPELQDRLLLTFHYALKPGGVLFLSPSESIGPHTALFAPLVRKHKIYQVKPMGIPARSLATAGPAWYGLPPAHEPAAKLPAANVADLAKRVLLQSFTPPSVVIDVKGDILYVHGDTGRYLRPAPGQASLNVIDMARPGLQLELRTALRTAAQKKRLVLLKNLQIKTNGGIHGVDVSVRPLSEPSAPEHCLVVSFQDAGPAPAGKAPTAGAAGKAPRVSPAAAAKEARRLQELEDLLLHTKETLQANNEELQAANEELKSGNEELQSTNEELQSTNEELDTSKEELQSVNEELVTVNSELQSKNDLLMGIQNDLRNLLDNTEAGTIFLDDRLAIKRFTRQAARAYRLAASDVGRALGERAAGAGLARADGEAGADGGRRVLPSADSALPDAGQRDRGRGADVHGHQRAQEGRGPRPGRRRGGQERYGPREGLAPMARERPTAKEKAAALALRKAAEKKAAPPKATPRTVAGRKAQEDLHELHVHQIELEMQNESLRETQASLEEARDRYVDLYDFAPVGYFTLSRAGHVLEVNLTGATMLGVPRPKLFRRGLGRFVTPECLAQWDRHLAGALQADTHHTCELLLRREDGSTFFARLDSVASGAAGRGGQALRTALTDVTERRQLEETQLFLSQCGWGSADEDFFHALAPHLARCLDMSYVCIDRLEGDGLTARTLALYVDGEFQDNIQYALKDTPCGDVVDKAFCCFPKGVAGLFPADVVLGQMKAQSYAGVTLRDFRGEPIGLIAVIGQRPMSNPRLAESVLKLVAIRAAGELERRQTQESLRRADAELKRSNEDLAQFAYVAGHDLQEPLRMVRGFLALLKEQYAAQLEVDGATRMSQLITDLLTYSRVGRKGSPVHPTDANAPLAAALANLRGSIELAQATVGHAPLPTVLADASQLTQLFQNLIGNALKFRCPDRPCRIDVTAESRQGHWEFSVRDNGIGIPPAARDRVFLIFERLHTRDKYAGTGIGLAVCKKIVERHGGRIWVDSAAAEGVTFRFTLPAAP